MDATTSKNENGSLIMRKITDFFLLRMVLINWPTSSPMSMTLCPRLIFSIIQCSIPFIILIGTRYLFVSALLVLTPNVHVNTFKSMGVSFSINPILNW